MNELDEIFAIVKIFNDLTATDPKAYEVWNKLVVNKSF